MNNAPVVVDLFCGCGGFGLGAELAGFNVIAAVDIDPTLQSSYARNFPNTKVINGDLSKMNDKSWKVILSGRAVDGVIGGPPCQGYSRMGHSDKNDPRRSLLRHFFRTINIISPKFFVMENVEGLMDEKNIYELKSALKILDKKYRVLKPAIIDASEYGAPTKRKRVVIIGYLPEMVGYPLDEKSFHPRNIIKTTVRDAIYDLPGPIGNNKVKNSDDYSWSRYKELPENELSEYAKKKRELPSGGMGWPVAIEYLLKGKLSGFLNTTHSPLVKARYSAVPQGAVDSVSKSKCLSWEGLCPTLRAGTGSDKGSHQAVRPLHPEEGRVITVREAARLQGFPDWFVFHHTKWHSFRMIGNSVSPIISESIMSVIYSSISSHEIEKIS
ncbi:Modification methylase HaeIII [Serratia quinivorans]|uniref:DNA cytosine methyltransferase n=1 Tax=Serratia quinivorans TaxID=137545 RepID=UPI00217BCB2C|nr:DNA cytosine methyltransferase [Serratia quinivorans]CAI1870490.1 Modification methylase HaeIII [Serratia quinivorans]